MNNSLLYLQQQVYYLENCKNPHFLISKKPYSKNNK